jgi:hypothetical protein
MEQAREHLHELQLRVQGLLAKVASASADEAQAQATVARAKAEALKNPNGESNAKFNSAQAALVEARSHLAAARYKLQLAQIEVDGNRQKVAALAEKQLDKAQARTASKFFLFSVILSFSPFDSRFLCTGVSQ